MDRVLAWCSAGFSSELVAGFVLECMADFVGISKIAPAAAENASMISLSNRIGGHVQIQTFNSLSRGSSPDCPELSPDSPGLESNEVVEGSRFSHHNSQAQSNLKSEATPITIPISGRTGGKLAMSVLEQVTKIVAKQLDKDPSEFNESTDLQEAGFESLDVIEMIFNLEDKFQIDIPFNANEADTIQMRTVGDITRMVETLIANKAAT